jgi:hypothetical protein
MSKLAYIVIPYNVSEDKSKDILKKDYLQTINMLEVMNISHEMSKVLTVCFREDIFYGYIYESDNSFFIKQLPSDYCKLSCIEDGVYNFAFDFSYFKTRKDKLTQYGEEFQNKYSAYEKDTKFKWQEIDSSKSICIKVNEDITYPVPPFVGILEALYDIEDYKALQLAKTELDNYKILSFKIPVDNEGNMKIDKTLRDGFIAEILNQLPERVGAVVTPFEVGDHNFEKNTLNADTVARSEDAYYNASGVNKMLFNSDKASSSVLIESIKTDYDMVACVLKQIERWINRKIKKSNVRNFFKIKFLDVTSFNQKDMFDLFLRGGQGGLPVKMALSSILGYSPSDVLTMGLLENDILQLRDTIFSEPLLSSSTMSPDNEGGRPTNKEKGDGLTESGEQTAEDDENSDRV